MPNKKEASTNDRKSILLPTIEELRASQKQGGEGRGLPENSTGPLNSCQGHEVSIRE